MRTLHVGTHDGACLDFPLTYASANKLVQHGAVCLCEKGKDHDLHLTPDFPWDVEDVEKLLIAIAEGSLLS